MPNVVAQTPPVPAPPVPTPSVSAPPVSSLPVPTLPTIEANVSAPVSKLPEGVIAQKSSAPPERVGGDVSPPVLISKVEPEYSAAAHKAKYSGSVLVSLVVDANGLPQDIHVVRPVGLGLDEKAVEAVTQWRFHPGTKSGRPVPILAQVEVTFRPL